MYPRFHNGKYFAVAVTAFIFAACAAGKDYNRPDVDLPTQFSFTKDADSSHATRPWREYFKDTALVRLIDAALDHNFDLQVALKRIDAAHSYARQARLAWLPALDLQINASTSNPSQNSLNGISLENFLGVSHIEDYTLAANLSWEIDVWGKIRRQKEAALASYLQTYEARRAIETEVVAQVAIAYYNLLMLDAQLDVAQRNVTLSDSIVAIMRLQKNAGQVTELAVQQALSQRDDAALLVPQLEQAIALQENGLQLISGQMPGGLPRMVRLTEVSMEEPLTTGVPADLLRYRPDVRSQENALREANARVGIAQANLYPSLLLTATGGLNAVKATDWFTMPASLFGTAAGTLLQPVFQRRALKTQVEVAMAERDEQVIRFRQSVTVAVHEVTGALVKIDKLVRQEEVAASRAQTLRQAVNNSRLLFQSGMANYLEVISAQSRVLQAELEAASIRRSQLTARVELYQSLGGGWTN